MKKGFTPLESSTPYCGWNEYNPSRFSERTVGSKVPSFLTGFTLIEALLVISIIGILSAIVIPNYQGASRQLALERSAHKLAQDIRSAGEMAMSARELAGGEVTAGYGIYTSTASSVTSYILYADRQATKDEKYTDSSEDVETISLEKDVQIKSVEVQGVSQSSLSLNFRPPSPTVKFSPSGSVATITLYLPKDPSRTKTIRVNIAGLVDID